MSHYFSITTHDDVIKLKHLPRYWPIVRGIHRSPVNSPHKGQWRGALMFSLICAWINAWVNTREAGDLRCHRAHYDVTVMESKLVCLSIQFHGRVISGAVVITYACIGNDHCWYRFRLYFVTVLLVCLSIQFYGRMISDGATYAWIVNGHLWYRFRLYFATVLPQKGEVLFKKYSWLISIQIRHKSTFMFWNLKFHNENLISHLFIYNQI